MGDIFGAPLAAEALFAFFLESVFLGVLLFGRNKVSSLFYTVSAWLVWAGSCLSALWILIANSWMQTPAGAELAELFGLKTVAKGVKVQFVESKIVVDAIITVMYGRNIVSVAKAVQEKVLSVVQSTTGIENAEVNVHVSGVAFEK